MDVLQLSDRLRKHIRSLHERQGRDQHQEFLAEGVIVCRELLRSRLYHALFVVVRREGNEEAWRLAREFAQRNVPIYAAEGRRFESLFEVQTPQDILAVVSYPERSAPLSGQRVVVLDGVSDPGNLGTIIRTAVWFDCPDVAVLPGSADPFQPKVVRASAGAIFHAVVRRVEAAEPFLRQLRAQGYRLLGAQPDALNELPALKIPQRAALVFGSEAHGLSTAVRAQCDQLFRIPGSSALDSLNVAVAAALTLYHCWLQRAHAPVHPRSGRRPR
jgi:TrmH family RNA methyltransferase